MKVTALIAEDEPLLAQALQDELAGLWPELSIVAVSPNGVRAQQDLFALAPDVDKYVSVVTENHELLIREPLRELAPRLDPNRFAQVHRGTIVNLECVESAARDESGKLWLRLRGRSERLNVSRIYAHLFKAM